MEGWSYFGADPEWGLRQVYLLTFSLLYVGSHTHNDCRSVTKYVDKNHQNREVLYVIIYTK